MAELHNASATEARTQDQRGMQLTAHPYRNVGQQCEPSDTQVYREATKCHDLRPNGSFSSTGGKEETT